MDMRELSSFEQVVAATKSIVEQALFFDALMHDLAGRSFPLNRGEQINKQVASYMRENFSSEIEEQLIYAALLADTYLDFITLPVA